MPLPLSYFGASGAAVGGKTAFPLSGMHHYQLVNPAAAASNGYQTTQAGPNTTTVSYYRTGYQPAGNTVFGGTLAAGVPDFARNVVITVTHATSVVALSGVISGVDIYGKAISEAWSVTATGTSKTFTGKKAFARVDLVTVVAAADASADSVVVGTGTVFGLPLLCAVGSAVKELSAGTVVTNGTVVAGSNTSTTDLRGTYSPNTAPNGATTYDVWYITDTPSASAAQ